MTHAHVVNRVMSYLAAGLILVGASGSTPFAQTYWFEDYERAVALIDAGQAAEAAPVLDRVIKEHPLPVACLKVPGDRCIDYIPYFQRARIQISRGDAHGAAHSLDVTEAFGVGLTNKRTEKELLLMRQQVRKMQGGRTQTPTTVTPASDPQ